MTTPVSGSRRASPFARSSAGVGARSGAAPSSTPAAGSTPTETPAAASASPVAGGRTRGASPIGNRAAIGATRPATTAPADAPAAVAPRAATSPAASQTAAASPRATVRAPVAGGTERVTAGRGTSPIAAGGRRTAVAAASTPGRTTASAAPTTPSVSASEAVAQAEQAAEAARASMISARAEAAAAQETEEVPVATAFEWQTKPRTRAPRPEPKPRSQSSGASLPPMPRSLPGKSDPKVQTILNAMGDLAAVLVAENNALVVHDVATVKTLARSKAQLTRYYQEQMLAVKRDPGLLLRLPDDQRAVMRQAGDIMEAVSSENGRLLKANIRTHNQLIQAVVDAVKERQTKESTSYSPEGSLDGDPTQAFKKAVSYNETL